MDEVVTIVTASQSNSTVFCGQGQETWLLSIAATCAVGLSGIIPLAIIPVEVAERSKLEGIIKVKRLTIKIKRAALIVTVVYSEYKLYIHVYHI